MTRSVPQQKLVDAFVTFSLIRALSTPDCSVCHHESDGHITLDGKTVCFCYSCLKVEASHPEHPHHATLAQAHEEMRRHNHQHHGSCCGRHRNGWRDRK